MQLLARHIDWQSEKNRRQHILAASDELMVQIQRMRECFLGYTLPLPTAKVIAVWNNLPNITMDNLSITMKTERVFRAPPPVPTGLALDAVRPRSSDLSSNSSHDDDDWLLVDDITSSSFDVVVPRALESEDDDSMSRCSLPEQSLDRINEEDTFQSVDSNSLSSDQESFSSGSGASSMPVGFHNTVNQWLMDYRARGTDAFIESLIAFGVVSVGTAKLASRVARAMVRKVAKTSEREAGNLENTIRFSALVAFQKYWKSDDTSMQVSYAESNTALPTSYGISIASLMGSLFDEKISTAKDVHFCFSLLLEGEKRFNRLCAIHALLVQANDKLCKNRNLPALMKFRDDITSTSEESGESIWATTPRSKMILADILATIERWMASQALRREQSRMVSWTGNRTIRNSAVGPRLRNGPVETCRG